MPTYIDKALSKHSKALILTFGALVLAASIPTIATGLFSGMYGTRREPSVQEIEDDDYPGEPEDWDETQLHAWLEKRFVYPPGDISKSELINLVVCLRKES